MDRTISYYARSEQAHWSNARDTPAGDNEEPWFEGGQCGLLALTIQAHLCLYVKQKLAHDSSLMKKSGRPLLDYALRPKRVTPIILPYNVHYDIPLIDLELVKPLLENGAEPNRKIRIYQDRSAWLIFLLSCRKNWDGWSRPTKECVFSVIQLLLRHGADPIISIPPVFKASEPNAEMARYKGRVVLERVKYQTYPTALDLFDELFDSAGSLELRTIASDIVGARRNRKNFQPVLDMAEH